MRGLCEVQGENKLPLSREGCKPSSPAGPALQQRTDPSWLRPPQENRPTPCDRAQSRAATASPPWPVSTEFPRRRGTHSHFPEPLGEGESPPAPCSLPAAPALACLAFLPCRPDRSHLSRAFPKPLLAGRSRAGGAPGKPAEERARRAEERGEAAAGGAALRRGHLRGGTWRAPRRGRTGGWCSLQGLRPERVTPPWSGEIVRSRKERSGIDLNPLSSFRLGYSRRGGERVGNANEPGKKERWEDGDALIFGFVSHYQRLF